MARIRGNVLCVDDDQSFLTMNKIILESAGYKVVTTTRPPEAEQLVGKGEVDGVIVDYEMPGMNGASLAKRLRKLQPGMPILMYSGVTYPPADAHGVVDGFIRKGEPINSFVAKVAEMIPTVAGQTTHDDWGRLLPYFAASLASFVGWTIWRRFRREVA